MTLTKKQYQKKYGAGWKDQLAKDTATYKGTLADFAAFKGPSSGFALAGTGDSSTYKPGSHKYKKAIQQANAQLPHEQKKGLKGFLNKVMPKVIGGAAVAGVGAGLVGAALGGGASSAISSAGEAIGDAVGAGGDLLSSVTGGFGSVGTGLGTVIGGDGMGESWLDDVFSGLNKAGQYANQGRAALESLGNAFGGGGGDQDYGGGSGGDMGPVQAPASSGAGWSKSMPWILGGLGVLIVLVLVLKRK